MVRGHPGEPGLAGLISSTAAGLFVRTNVRRHSSEVVNFKLGVGEGFRWATVRGHPGEPGLAGLISSTAAGRK